MTSLRSKFSKLAVGATLVALVGCGASPTSGETEESGAAVQEGAGAEENVIVVADTEPDFLTPGRGYSYNAYNTIFAPLMRIDKSGEIEFVQAEAIDTDDNQTWTITVQPDWTFHNGEPVTAHSFVNAWNATAYGPNAWVNSGSFANFEGYEDLNPASGEPETSEMSGATVLDEYTIEVKLTKPDSQFPLALATGPAFMPLPEVAFDDFDAFDREPIGNGPYRLGATPDSSAGMELVRFEEYRGPEPANDGIVFRYYSDLHTAYTDAQGDAIDIFRVPVDKWPHVEADFGERFEAFEAPALQFLGFPLDDPRFSDVRIRQAISLAIDRDAINEVVFGGLNSPATSITSPAHTGAPADLCDYCAFDPDRAKDLLDAAGGWGDDPLHLWLPGGLGYEPLFTAIANQIRQNLEISDVEIKTLPGFTPFFEALNDGSMDGAFRGMWGSFYPSMAELLTELFSPNGGGQFSTNYVNESALRLVEEGNAAVELDEQVKNYIQAEREILADAPIVPLFYDSYVYAWSDNVTDVEVDFTPLNLTKARVK